MDVLIGGRKWSTLRHLLIAVFFVIGCALFAIFAGACSFAPDVADGSIACSAVDRSCPPGFTCGDDGRCHSGTGSSTSSGGDGGDDDSGPFTPSNLLITDQSFIEGKSGFTDATFLVRLVPASTREVKVDWSTLDDTAKAPADYTAATGTLVFAPGETSKPIIVKIAANDRVQTNRKFLVALSNPQNATLSIPQAIGTILDDDTFGLVVVDTTVMEGQTGFNDALFDVHLTGPSNTAVSVSYSTIEGTATEGKDYIKVSGTLAFDPGETDHTVKVPIKGNTANDSDRFFFLTLANATNAPILNGQAQGKIIDDDALPSLSIDDVSVPEGDLGPAMTSMTFHVTLSAPSLNPVSVAFATANGTATTTDYAAMNGTLTFAPGETDKTIVIAVNGDARDEDDETFTITLSAPTNAIIGKATGTGTIQDNDPVPAITIDDVSVAEGQAGTTTFTFPVRLSAPSGRSVTVNYATENDTATAASDYTAASGVVTFAAGETEKAITVSVLGDAVDEGPERFLVRLSAPTNATLDRDTAAGTILNDDSSLPSLTIGNATFAEGNGGPTTVTFAITLTPAAAQDVTVSWATSDETATAGSDYVAANGSVTFTTGQTSKTVNVTVNGDNAFEPNETFLVSLFNATNANILTAQGRGTITNDDVMPTLSIAAPPAFTEGNAGTTAAVFTVTLSNASNQEVSVAFATSNGTAVAPGDYASASGMLNFSPGETSKTVTVNVNGDQVYEPDESFNVTLSNPVGATIATPTAAATITNDESAPTISIDDVSAAEGNTGTSKSFSFRVTLSGPSSTAITVAYATADGTATAGSDYTATNGMLTFAPGEVTKMIDVTVQGDVADEAAETFVVNLSGPTGGATLLDGQGQGTILNDDSALPTLSVGDTTVVEGNSGTAMAVFTVTLSAMSAQTVTVSYATADGTATTTNADYVATSNVLTFMPGEVSKTVNVTVNGDAVSEADETFFLNLSTPMNASIFDGQGQATIQNDDLGPALSINDVSMAEGNAGNAFATFTVTLSAVAGQTVTVNFATEDVTASAGTDYEATSGSLTFLAGETSKTVRVKVFGDALSEGDETYRVRLSNPVNAVITDDIGVGTITNDDSQVTISVNDASVVEGNSGNTQLTFTVTLSAVSGAAVTVTYATADGTAVSGTDYTQKTGMVTIPAGQLSKTFSIAVKGDTAVEANETFLVNLSNADGATIVDGQGIGTILNDD